MFHFCLWWPLKINAETQKKQLLFSKKLYHRWVTGWDFFYSLRRQRCYLVPNHHLTVACLFQWKRYLSSLLPPLLRLPQLLQQTIRTTKTMKPRPLLHHPRNRARNRRAKPTKVLYLVKTCFCDWLFFYNHFCWVMWSTFSDFLICF